MTATIREIFFSPIAILVQGLNFSSEECGNAHILYEKPCLSLAKVSSGPVATRQWHKRATVQYQYCLKGSVIYFQTHHLPKVTMLGRDEAEIQIQFRLSCAKLPQFPYIQFVFQLEWNAGPTFIFYSHGVSITKLFWSNKSICLLVKTSNNCCLNSYLIKKSFSQRGNKVCKEITLLKHTFNLHCQMAHLSM